jgi:hypothetical protein
MMDLSIVIPYKYNEEREPLFQFVCNYYKKILPDAEIVLGIDDTGKEKFNRGYAINSGCEQATNDIILINDGDIFIDKPTLMKGIGLLKDSPFVIPWGRCWDVVPQKSLSIIKHGFRGKVCKLKKFAYMTRDIRPGHGIMGFDKCAGGLGLVKKDFFNEIGGFDPRLMTWGFRGHPFLYES